jgi:hypothetical protein
MGFVKISILFFISFAVMQCSKDSPNKPPDSKNGIQSRQILTGGGNFTNGSTDNDMVARLKALNSIGANMCRLNLYPEYYWNQTSRTPTPEKNDTFIKLAHSHQITPVILFEFYHDYTHPPRDYDTWYRIGRGYAERFRPNSPWLKSQNINDWGVSIYSAINEPDAAYTIDKTDFYNMLKGLADGVHAVDSSLSVIPGGFMSENAFSDHTLRGYGQAIAPLINEGILAGIDLHTYNDVQYAPIEVGVNSGNIKWEHSPQEDFDQVKKGCGITRDIAFYATEYGFKNNTQGITGDYCAKRELTCIWANFGIVGNDHKSPATVFAFPWNIFHLESEDVTYGMSVNKDPWEGNKRGQIYKFICQLVKEVSFVSLDPHKSGIYILQSDVKKLWVWQNLPHWSTIYGNSLHIDNIPDSAESLTVYGYDAPWNGARQSIQLEGENSLTVSDLAQGETLMLLAE